MTGGCPLVGHHRQPSSTADASDRVVDGNAESTCRARLSELPRLFASVYCIIATPRLPKLPVPGLPPPDGMSLLQIWTALWMPLFAAGPVATT